MVLGQKLIDNGNRLGLKTGENAHNLGNKIKSHTRVTMPYYMPSNQDNTPKKSPLER
jgi:hypothetical protein